MRDAALPDPSRAAIEIEVVSRSASIVDPRMTESPPALLATGRVFHHRYEVVRCLRAGGMGAVYEVVDQKTRRRRALKVMLPSVVSDPDLRARFKLEATITAEIESEHIVETLDADVDSETGSPFVLMDLLKGDDLGAVLAQRRRLPPDEVVLLLRQAARALDRTHAAGVVHRDLKPENLFLTRGDDGRPKLKVLDFGIAKIVAESSAPLLTTRAMGTPLYMPPEQIRGDGDIGPQADLYALAHVAFALLVGEPYWKEDRGPSVFVVFNRILSGCVDPPTSRAMRRRGVSLPPTFDAWFLKATAVQPEDRFETATAEIAALEDALSGEGATAGAAPSGSLPLPGASQAAPAFTPCEPEPGPTQILTGRDLAPMTAAISDEDTPPVRRRRAAPWLVGGAVILAGVAASVITLLRQPAQSADAASPTSASREGSAPPDSPSVLAPAGAARPGPSAPSAAPVPSPPVASSAPARVSTPSRSSAPRVATPRRGAYDPTDVR
jgi:eukaryotic-like serine/threonine-protein kinase